MLKEIISNQKKQIILSILVTVLPVILGCIMWNKLPSKLPYHFAGFTPSTANAWANKEDVIFGIIALLIIMQVIMIISILIMLLLYKHNADIVSKAEKKLMTTKVIYILYWSMPVTSLYVYYLVYGSVMK